MLHVQRTIDHTTLRLVHDLSPESDNSSDEDDENIAVKRERFFISCLAQSAINNNNSISHVTNSACDRTCDSRARSRDRNTCDSHSHAHAQNDTERITETYSKIELNQHNLERINNHINEQHLYTLLEKPRHNINQINNNFLQSLEYDDHTNNKENIRPRTSSGSSGAVSSTVGTEKCAGAKRPRRLPDVPKKAPTQAHPSLPLRPKLVDNEKCLADELQAALTKPDNDNDDVFANTRDESPLSKDYPKYSCNFLQELKGGRFTNSVSKNTRAYLNSDNMYLKEDSTVCTEEHSHVKCRDFEADARDKTRDIARDREVASREKPRDMEVASSGKGGDDGGGEGRTSMTETEQHTNTRRSSTCFPSKNYHDLTVTHRGMHRFIPRHKDEIAIEIGDPIHVVKTGDDLWCEGVNLRSNERGVFPSMYATDLGFLEEEEEENGCSKFFLRFLGSVEVNYHKGDEVLCQAINKVALSRRALKSSQPPPVCTMEVSQYGIRMFDKSMTGHENTEETFTHFFALKNITFCGHHPRNERYFGFITKHPNQYRYACHVFLGEKSTRSVSDAMGQAFKRFYQEYMAFTHPTEDIYME